VRVPGAFAGGRPVHRDGVVSRVPGLYFAGLDFSVARKSGTIHAIAGEAARIAEHVAGFLRR
jgi:putative flavoprotein involved in K+ transport